MEKDFYWKVCFYIKISVEVRAPVQLTYLGAKCSGHMT